MLNLILEGFKNDKNEIYIFTSNKKNLFLNNSYTDDS